MPTMPCAPQIHLLKLFDNVKSLSFGRGSKQVFGMGSSEGESFLLREPVTVEGPVEGWMTAVEIEMCNSLRSITKEGVYRYADEERQEWITNVLGMVSLVGSQIWWTWEVKHADICLRCLNFQANFPVALSNVFSDPSEPIYVVFNDG